MHFASCLILIAILMANPDPTFAQPDSLWSRTYGGDGNDWCYSVMQPEGGYALAGYTYSFGAGMSDFWLVKADVNGDSLWSRTYGGVDRDVCLTTEQTSDGGFALAGYTESFAAGDFDFWLVKTAANGDSLWSRAYGGSGEDRCYAVKQIPDGGYILAGYTESFGAGQNDAWLVKVNANGDSLWSRTFGGAANDYCWSIQITDDGGYILGGSSETNSSGREDFWILKTDANGDSLWGNSFGGNVYDACWSILQAADGGYMMAGYTGSFGSGGYDFWLLKTDASGDSLWSRTFGGFEADGCQSIIPTADGGYALTGYTRSAGAGDMDIWLVKVDAAGNVLWTQTFGGGESDRAFEVRQTADGSFVLGGYTYTFGSGSADFWLVKTGPDPVSESADPFILSPASFRLSVYPNPFNPSTTIRYDLTRQAPVTITVYDIMGRQVAELVNRTMPAGAHAIRWDGTSYTTGVYLIEMSTDGFREGRKALLIR